MTAGIALFFRSLWRSWRRDGHPPLPKPAAPAPAPAPPDAPPPLEFIQAKLHGDIVWSPSPNYQTIKTRKVELVVLHATAGAFRGAISWLRKKNRKHRTSAHYVISKAGEVVQLVSEDAVSWHGGRGRWLGKGGINGRSIGIEMENLNDGTDPYPEKLLESTLWLTLQACRRYGIPAEDVVGHADIDPKRKTDPREFPWLRFRYSLERELQIPETA